MPGYGRDAIADLPQKGTEGIVEKDISNVLFGLAGNTQHSGFDHVLAIQVEKARGSLKTLGSKGPLTHDTPEVITAEAVYTLLGGEAGLVDPVLEGKSLTACTYGFHAGRHRVLREVATRSIWDMTKCADRSAATKLFSIRVALLECGLLENDTNVIFDHLGQLIVDAAGVTGESVESMMKSVSMETLPGLLSDIESRTQPAKSPPGHQNRNQLPKASSGHFVFHLEAIHANDFGALTIVSVASFEKLQKSTYNSLMLGRQHKKLTDASATYGASLRRLAGVVSAFTQRSGPIVREAGTSAEAPCSSLLLLAPIRNPPGPHFRLITQECFRLRDEHDLALFRKDPEQTVLKTPVGRWHGRCCCLPSPPPSEESSATDSSAPSDVSSFELMQMQESFNDGSCAPDRLLLESLRMGQEETLWQTMNDGKSTRNSFGGSLTSSIGRSHTVSLGGTQAFGLVGSHGHHMLSVSQTGGVANGCGGSVNPIASAATDAALAGAVAVPGVAGVRNAVATTSEEMQRGRCLEALSIDSPRTVLLKHLMSAEEAFESDEFLCRGHSESSEEQVQSLLTIIERVQKSYHDTIDLTRRFLQQQVQSITHHPHDMARKYTASTSCISLTTGSDLGMESSAAYYSIGGSIGSSDNTMRTCSPLMADRTSIAVTPTSVHGQWPLKLQAPQSPSTTTSTGSAHRQTLGSAGVPACPTSSAVCYGVYSEPTTPQLHRSPRCDEENVSPAHRPLVAGSPSASEVSTRPASNMQRLGLRHHSEWVLSAHKTLASTPQSLKKQLDGLCSGMSECHSSAESVSSPVRSASPLARSRSANLTASGTPIYNTPCRDMTVSPQLPFRRPVRQDLRSPVNPTGSALLPGESPKFFGQPLIARIGDRGSHPPFSPPFIPPFKASGGQSSMLTSSRQCEAKLVASPRRRVLRDDGCCCPSTPLATSAMKAEGRRNGPITASLSWVQPVENRQVVMETSSDLSWEQSANTMRGDGSPYFDLH